MKAILPRIKREWVDEILVVDGASTDGTPEFAESMGIRVLQQTRKGGTGAYQDAVEQITNDIIITFSPDGNSVPELIPVLVEKMKEGYDMVIVSRYAKGAKSADDTIVTAFGNWLFTSMINLLYGSRYTDVLVMFRAWRTDLLRSSTKDIPPLAGYELYFSIKCAKEKRKVADIPGDEPKRIGGISKLNPLANGFAALKLILSERFK